MKKLLAILLIAFAATACTPEEVRWWNALSVDEDVPEPPHIGNDRTAAMTLPVTVVTRKVYGTTVNVVAWYGQGGKDHGDFVYQDADGRRWIFTADSFGGGYSWLLTDNPCEFDAFNGVTGTDC